MGTSGWTYAPWRGKFYPKKHPQKRELEFYSRKLNSVEVNGTFYSILKPATFKGWFDQTPDDFVFAVKANQYITHVRRLKDFQAPLANFLASGVLSLGRKLGPLLWQLPPNFMLKDDRVERFLDDLPRDTLSAAAYAKKHLSDWMKDQAWTEVSRADNQPLLHAFEFRHPSFKSAAFLELLRKHAVAIVIADSGKKSPFMEDVTGPFIYARMHGERAEYKKKGYTDKAIARWAPRFQSWASGKIPKDSELLLPVPPKASERPVFVYFDTETKAYAPANALNLSQQLGLIDERSGK